MKMIAKFILCALLICGVSIADERVMSDKDAQKTWDEYHERIKNRRLAEAKVINKELEKNSITSETDLVLDFSFFTQDEAGANALKNQLSENYEMTITKKDEYWHIKGTSRPYAVNLSADQHMGWVEFMHDVALSFGCIFSTWSITEPKYNITWSNEKIETEFN